MVSSFWPIHAIEIVVLADSVLLHFGQVMNMFTNTFPTLKATLTFGDESWNRPNG